MSSVPPPPRFDLTPVNPRRGLVVQTEPFLTRLIQLPFVPRLWSAAAHWGTGAVILPLVVLTTLLGGTLAAYRSFGLRSDMAQWATAYDAGYPAVILENGEARVEGGGVIQVDLEGSTLLVDPEETVPLGEIDRPEYVVVRKREIIQHRRFNTERTRISDLEPLLGKGPTRIDGAAIRRFDARWGLALQVGVGVLMIGFLLITQLGGVALYSLIGGGLALLFRGRSLGLGFGACYRVALAVSSLTIVVDILSSWFGSSPGFCLGWLIWPTAITALATWAVGRD